MPVDGADNVDAEEADGDVRFAKFDDAVVVVVATVDGLVESELPLCTSLRKGGTEGFVVVERHRLGPSLSRTKQEMVLSCVNDVDFHNLVGGEQSVPLRSAFRTRFGQIQPEVAAPHIS